MVFIKPKSGLKKFTCPHCDAIARQYHWGYKNVQNCGPIAQENPKYSSTILRMSMCEHCNKISVWNSEKLLYPDRGGAPSPNPDMPNDVKQDYEEASLILSKSPRGSAALLRLAIQKLCVHLGGKGKNINDDVKQLVKDGLPYQVQQALDVVRVTGNNAVHPGQIDVNDIEVAAELFPLINVIVEYMISLPTKINGLYSNLPEGAKEAINNRDQMNKG